jgi:glycosyltransferase involved in cell wall biosynthesis
VIVDDGSSDRGRAIAEVFAGRDARFQLVSTEHRGLVDALNTGLERCRAPYVARMDSDDWMHRDRLDQQYRHLERHRDLGAVGCGVRLFPRRELQAGRLRYESWLNSITSPRELRRDAFVECPVAHPTLMIRRSLLAKHGYRDRGWPEDYDLVLRLLNAGEAIGVIPRRLLGWRDSPGRLSRTGAAYRIERFTACKAHYLAASFLAGHRHYILWGYGHTGRGLRRALAQHELSPSHIVELHPGRIGQRIHGAAVIEPSRLAHLPRRPVVVSVAGLEPRSQIRAALGEMGFREGRDFVCAA